MSSYPSTPNDERLPASPLPSRVRRWIERAVRWVASSVGVVSRSVATDDPSTEKGNVGVADPATSTGLALTPEPQDEPFYIPDEQDPYPGWVRNEILTRRNDGRKLAQWYGGAPGPDVADVLGSERGGSSERDKLIDEMIEREDQEFLDKYGTSGTTE